MGAWSIALQSVPADNLPVSPLLGADMNLALLTATRHTSLLGTIVFTKRSRQRWKCAKAISNATVLASFGFS